MGLIITLNAVWRFKLRVTSPVAVKILYMTEQSVRRLQQNPSEGEVAIVRDAPARKKKYTWKS